MFGLLLGGFLGALLAGWNGRYGNLQKVTYIYPALRELDLALPGQLEPGNSLAQELPEYKLQDAFYNYMMGNNFSTDPDANDQSWNKTKNWDGKEGDESYWEYITGSARSEYEKDGYKNFDLLTDEEKRAYILKHAGYNTKEGYEAEKQAAELAAKAEALAQLDELSSLKRKQSAALTVYGKNANRKEGDKIGTAYGRRQARMQMRKNWWNLSPEERSELRNNGVSYIDYVRGTDYGKSRSLDYGTVGFGDYMDESSKIYDDQVREKEAEINKQSKGGTMKYYVTKNQDPAGGIEKLPKVLYVKGGLRQMNEIEEDVPFEMPVNGENNKGTLKYNVDGEGNVNKYYLSDTTFNAEKQPVRIDKVWYDSTVSDSMGQPTLVRNFKQSYNVDPKTGQVTADKSSIQRSTKRYNNDKEKQPLYYLPKIVQAKQIGGNVVDELGGSQEQDLIGMLGGAAKNGGLSASGIAYGNNGYTKTRGDVNKTRNHIGDTSVAVGNRGDVTKTHTGDTNAFTSVGNRGDSFRGDTTKIQGGDTNIDGGNVLERLRKIGKNSTVNINIPQQLQQLCAKCRQPLYKNGGNLVKKKDQKVKPFKKENVKNDTKKIAENVKAIAKKGGKMCKGANGMPLLKKKSNGGAVPCNCK